MSTKITPALVNELVGKSPILKKTFELLERDEEVQSLVKMANIMAVGRLKYNDHGVVHSRIVSGAALLLLDLLLDAGVRPTTLEFSTCRNLTEAKVVVLMSAYLHDVGNAIHRVNHEWLGAILVKDIIDRILSDVLPRVGNRRYLIRQEIMHAIYATETNTKSLTLEAGVVKVADGLDMAEGRARIPYSLGVIDMHAVSALSVREVRIGRGKKRAAKIEINMNDFAGLFQVERVLKPKIVTSGIGDYLEVYVNVNGKTHRLYP